VHALRLPDSLHVLLWQMVRFETGLAYCPTTHWCIASAEGSIRDGPGVLPDGSPAALRRRV